MKQYWWERRSGTWDSFDPDPRRSYYKFLRAVYGCYADEAWMRVRVAFGDME